MEHEERERRRSEFEAQHDKLTQLPNRTALESRFSEVSKQEPARAARMALLFIDLDGFKAINDKYGHIVGDEVLMLLARRLGHGMRQGDFVARIGGDEFVALIKLEDDASKMTDIVAGKLTDLIEEPMHLKNINIQVGASIGLAIYPDDGKNLSDLMASADARMYTVKRSRER